MDTTTLTEERKVAFDDAMSDYDFEGEYAGADSITKDGNIWSCKVYLIDEGEDEDNDDYDSYAVSFMVEFKEDSAEIEYMSHDLI